MGFNKIILIISLIILMIAFEVWGTSLILTIIKIALDVSIDIGDINISLFFLWKKQKKE